MPQQKTVCIKFKQKQKSTKKYQFKYHRITKFDKNIFGKITINSMIFIQCYYKISIRRCSIFLKNLVNILMIFKYVLFDDFHSMFLSGLLKTLLLFSFLSYFIENSNFLTFYNFLLATLQEPLAIEFSVWYHRLETCLKQFFFNLVPSCEETSF